MGNILKVNHTSVFGEKEANNFISKYEPIKTEYDEQVNKINDLLASANIDKNICSDLLGLQVGITLKFPALPALPKLPNFFLPSINITCVPNIDIDVSIL